MELHITYIDTQMFTNHFKKYRLKAIRNSQLVTEYCIIFQLLFISTISYQLMLFTYQ